MNKLSTLVYISLGRVRVIFSIILLLNVELSSAQLHDELIPYRSGAKWGYSTNIKKISITPIYDMVLPFDSGLAQVYLNQECGVVNERNQIIIPIAKQDLIKVKSDLFIKAILQGEEMIMGVIDTNNNTIIPFEYDYIRPVHGILELKKLNKYGICDYKGNILIEPIYDYIDFPETSLCILRKDNLQALFTIQGRQLTDFKYVVIGNFRNNLSKVRLRDLFGFVDKSGREVIPPVYEMVYPFSQGYAVIVKEKKYGLIDTSGRIVVKPEYDFMGDIHGGSASVKTGDKWALVDINGKKIANREFNEIKRVYNGTTAARIDNKWALLGPRGQALTAFEFDEIQINEGDESKVRDFGSKSLENDPGYLLISKNKKWGIVDSSGKKIINPEYDNIYPFTHGAALLERNGKWAIASSAGRLKTDFRYDALEPYIAGSFNLKNYGIILYQRNNLWGLVDFQGKEITAPLYDNLRSSDDNYYRVIKNKKMGVIDGDGKEVIPPKYDLIKTQPTRNSFDDVIFKNNFCVVQKDGKLGYVSKEGVEYFE